MRLQGLAVALGLVLLSAPAHAQNPPQAAPRGSDVYVVSFFRAAPGQAAALVKQLQEQDPKDPMAGQFLLLAHAQGADWDYCLVEHRGTSATVAVTQPVPTSMPMWDWHADTFVSGPSWAEFSKLMNITPGGGGAYVVSTQNAIRGHRGELYTALNASDDKVPVSRVILEHIDGGPWTFLTLERYNNWQDFATEIGANPPGGQGWNELRMHSASHQDTLAERVR